MTTEVGIDGYRYLLTHRRSFPEPRSDPEWEGTLSADARDQIAVWRGRGWHVDLIRHDGIPQRVPKSKSTEGGF